MAAPFTPERALNTILLTIAALNLFGMAEVTPMVMEDGKHEFVFWGKPEKERPEVFSDDSVWMKRTISILLAQQNWCLNGWEITSLEQTEGHILAEGRCL